MPLAPNAMTYQTALIQTIPQPMRGPNTVAFMGSIGQAIDELVDGARSAVQHRFPNYISDDTLALTTRERGMFRGPNQTAESHATQLCAWWDTQKAGGGYRPLLEQMQLYFSPLKPEISVYLNNGTIQTIGDDGEITSAYRAWNWDGHTHTDYPATGRWDDPWGMDNTDLHWDDAGTWDYVQPTEYWSRFWVVMLAEDASVTRDTSTWDVPWGNRSDTHWDDPGCWDAEDGSVIAGLQQVMEAFRPPHAHCEEIILVTDPTTWATVYPGGTWQYWANRSLAAIYCKGT